MSATDHRLDIAGVALWLEARVGGYGEDLYDSDARYDDVALYDGEGPEAGWRDLNLVVTSVQCGRGVTAARGRSPTLRAGTLSATFYDPERLTDPVLARYDLRPMQEVRLRSDVGTVWTGYADEWTYDYLSRTGFMAATDAVKILAAYTTSLPLPAQRTADRASALLAAVPRALPSRVVGRGQRLAAATLTGDIASQIDLVAESEGGVVFVAGDGTVVFRCRATPEAARARVVLAEAADPSGDVAVDAVYHEFLHEIADGTLANIVAVDRVRGPSQKPSPVVASSDASIARYLPSRVEFPSLQLATDSQLWDWAQLALALGAWPVAAPRTVIWRGWPPGRSDPEDLTSLTAYLALEVGDPVDVRLMTIMPGTVWQMSVLGVEHDITPDMWSLRLQVGFVEPWGTGVYDGPAGAALYDESNYAYRPLVEV